MPQANNRAIPRDDPGARFTGKSSDEALENDLGTQSNRITRLEKLMSNVVPHKGTIEFTGYNVAAASTVNTINVGPGLKVSVTGNTAYIKSRYRAFAEIVFVAMSTQQDYQVELNNREYYIAPYTIFRYVIHETNSDGNTYQFQYLHSGSWTNIDSAFTTPGAAAITYHSAWRNIPAGVLSVGMPVLRVNRSGSSANNDVSLCVIQLWDGEPDSAGSGGDSGQPPSSGETFPTPTTDTPSSAPVFTSP